MSQTQKHILVSPLDWGLGHATRCVPLINALLQKGFAVSIAGSGRSIDLLQKEFPQLKRYTLEGFSPSYASNSGMVWQMAKLIPQFLRARTREHKQLEQLIDKQKFDIIISDNRYGLWSKKAKTIFITHQIMIKTPAWLGFAEYGLYQVSKKLVSKFDECWIPDFEDENNLSGDLSHKHALPAHARFVGPLSRLTFLSKNENKKYKVAAIISGPEPQRTLFEEKLISQLSTLNFPSILVSGKPETQQQPQQIGKLTLLPFALSGEIEEIIRSSEIVVCRSGYTTVMDLHAMGAKALFVPTPGQTEQIYLAKLLKSRNIADWVDQRNLYIEKQLEQNAHYKGFSEQNDTCLLHLAIETLI